MADSYFNLVVAGHIDHGKSTLIGRLLYDTNSLAFDKISEAKKASQGLGVEMEFAYLLDHLQEERSAGMTIDTTMVFLKSKKREYAIIDSPGHAEFIKNMLTGASRANGAILIIDIKKGVEEETRRHAYMLSMLGLRQVIVVINKMDLVNYQKKEFIKICKSADKFLKAINMKPRFYLPVCAKNGANMATKSKLMPWYRSFTLLEALDKIKKEDNFKNKPAFFTVQDVYNINNKNICVGVVESGTLRKNQRVRIFPEDAIGKIKSIEEYGKRLSKVSYGQNTGLTLNNRLSLKRGNVICANKDYPVVTNRFKASIFWIDRKPLISGENLGLKCSFQERSCTINMIVEIFDAAKSKVIKRKSNRLSNLEIAKATITVDPPMVIGSFNKFMVLGRFVLLRNQELCGGGIIHGRF